MEGIAVPLGYQVVFLTLSVARRDEEAVIGDTGTCCDLRLHPGGISHISRIVRPNFRTGIPSGMRNHLSRRGFLSASAMASGAFLWKGCTAQHVFGDKFATKYTPADVANASGALSEPVSAVVDELDVRGGRPPAHHCDRGIVDLHIKGPS